MAKKGEKKSMKVYSTSKAVKALRRKPSLIARALPGAHPRESSIPLTIALRDIMQLARTAREARVILNDGRVQLDGRVVKNPRLPIGFMDVISLPSISKHYRVVYDPRGRLTAQETQDPSFKLCKIKDKTQTRNGLQLNLHDGRNILVKKDDYQTGGTLKISIPNQKIIEYYPMETGSIAYVSGGSHAGEVANIETIIPGSRSRQPLVVLKTDKKEFQTMKEFVFVLGTKKSAIKLREEK